MTSSAAVSATPSTRKPGNPNIASARPVTSLIVRGLPVVAVFEQPQRCTRPLTPTPRREPTPNPYSNAKGRLTSWRTPADHKVAHLMNHFASQESKTSFTEDTFRCLMRIRGIECPSPRGLAEAFHSPNGSLTIHNDYVYGEWGERVG